MRWRTSVGVKIFEELYDLIILEQFKNVIPDRLATYINKHTIEMAAETAVLGDTHKSTFRDHASCNFTSKDSCPRHFVGPSRTDITGTGSHTIWPVLVKWSFELQNVPSTFQCLMKKLITGLEGCTVHLDDVVIFSDVWDEHLIRINSLLKRLVGAKLIVNLAKCEFAHATVVHLGKVVGQGCVCPTRAKVLTIDRFPPPSAKRN